MSDTVKLIIEIPKETYKTITADKYAIYDKMYYSIKNGIPLDSVKAEIKEKCDRIDDIVRANIYQYVPRREMQELLCEILASIGKAESEDK